MLGSNVRVIKALGLFLGMGEGTPGPLAESPQSISHQALLSNEFR
jgi:hypothetical protein